MHFNAVLELNIMENLELLLSNDFYIYSKEERKGGWKKGPGYVPVECYCAAKCTLRLEIIWEIIHIMQFQTLDVFDLFLLCIKYLNSLQSEQMLSQKSSITGSFIIAGRCKVSQEQCRVERSTQCRMLCCSSKCSE